MAKIRKVTITIENFDNEAMSESPEQAIFDILDDIAKKAGDNIFSVPEIIRDYNGNPVGKVKVIYY